MSISVGSPNWRHIVRWSLFCGIVAINGIKGPRESNMRIHKSRLLIVAISALLISTTPLHAYTPSPTTVNPVLLKGLGQTEHTATLAPNVSGLALDSTAATPLPPSPASGTLVAGGFDLYRIEVTPGQRLELELTPGPGSNAVFDLYLYSPGLTMLPDAIAVAHATEGGYPKKIAYDIPSGLGGTYFIEVNAFAGAGDYRLKWNLLPATANARVDIPSALPLPAPSTISTDIPNVWGANKVFRITLPANRRVEIGLAGPSDSDFDLYLYAPGTTSLRPLTVVPQEFSNGPTSNESIILDTPAGTSQVWHLEVLRFNGYGRADITVDIDPVPAPPSATRVAGADRFATAAELSRRAYPAGSRTALLTSGRDFPDGLAAASLAGALNAPVLLTEPSILPVATANELARLRVTKVYIIGGSGPVSPAVVTALRARFPQLVIERIHGANRYATAAEVAHKVRQVTGVRPRTIFLASGETFPDALSLSGPAFLTRTPIILTPRAALHPASAEAIRSLRPVGGRMDVYVAGGVGAVSASAADAALFAAGGSMSRAAGINRFETSLIIAEDSVAAGWTQPRNLSIASGATFPDALASAALSGAHGGPLLLTQPNFLSTQVGDYLRSFDFAINHSFVVGGTGAIGVTTWNTLIGMLPPTPLR